jgi:uncharacterized membrane protein
VAWEKSSQEISREKKLISLGRTKYHMDQVQNTAGIGLAIGAGLGLIFGIMVNNIGLGIALGAAFGLIFGFSIGKKKETPTK